MDGDGSLANCTAVLLSARIISRPSSLSAFAEPVTTCGSPRPLHYSSNALLSTENCQIFHLTGPSTWFQNAWHISGRSCNRMHLYSLFFSLYLLLTTSFRRKNVRKTGRQGWMPYLRFDTSHPRKQDEPIQLFKATYTSIDRNEQINLNAKLTGSKLLVSNCRNWNGKQYQPDTQ